MTVKTGVRPLGSASRGSSTSVGSVYLFSAQVLGADLAIEGARLELHHGVHVHVEVWNLLMKHEGPRRKRFNLLGANIS